MKVFLSILLLAIISLSEAVQTNLRLFRSIPNRYHRGRPIKQKAVDPSLFDAINLKPIYIFFMQDEDAWNTLIQYLGISEESACQYCTRVNKFSYDNCKAFIDKLIECLKSGGWF